MTDLTEFLLARITEDEKVARDAIGGARPDWVVGCEETSDGENAFWAVEALGESSEWFADLGSQPSDGARALHIARYDPTRVLAECDAKRRIVELCERLDRKSSNDNLWNIDEDVEILAALALPYAGHPDYDEAWRP